MQKHQVFWGRRRDLFCIYWRGVSEWEGLQTINKYEKWFTIIAAVVIIEMPKFILFSLLFDQQMDSLELEQHSNASNFPTILCSFSKLQSFSIFAEESH